MTTTTTKTQLDLELVRLEKRIEELLAGMEQLKEENRALRQRHETLANERATPAATATSRCAPASRR